MAGTPVRVLTGEDVRQCLPMTEAIEVMRQAFISLSDGSAVAPQRLTIPLGQGGDRLLVMPSHYPSGRAAGVKIVSIVGDNPSRGIPLIHGMMAVIDAVDGTLAALMAAEDLTALRTGAASGLATQMLAREDATVLFLFGAGAQGRTQLEGVAAVRRLARAYVLDTSIDKAAAFAHDMSAMLGLEVVPVTSADALGTANIICTATTSREPLFDNDAVAPGTHINAVGAYHPDMREIPGLLVRRAKVVVDFRAAALSEAGDLMMPIRDGLCGLDHIHAELGEVAAVTKPGRENEKEITLFKSVGNAVQDIAAAVRVLSSARAKGIGKEITL